MKSLLSVLFLIAGYVYGVLATLFVLASVFSTSLLLRGLLFFIASYILLKISYYFKSKESAVQVSKTVDLNVAKYNQNSKPLPSASETSNSRRSSLDRIQYQEKYRKKHVFVDEYVVIDFETTGLNPEEDEIIEMAAIHFVNGEPTREFQSLVEPNGWISDFIAEKTGITNEMVEGAPTIDELLPHFLRFIGDSVIVAHYAPFDMKFLLYNIGALGLDHPVNNFVSDTVSMSRKYFPKLRNHKLPTLKEYLKLNHIESHRAYGDCFVAGKVYWACKAFKETQDQVLGG